MGHYDVEPKYNPVPRQAQPEPALGHQLDDMPDFTLIPPGVIVPPKHKSDGGSTAYYDIPDDVKDLQGLIEYKRMNFSVGNIFKACYRLGEKEGTDLLYDLNKIIFFAEREKARLSSKSSSTPS